MPSLLARHDRLIASALLGLYGAILLPTLFHHQIWMDEAQAWLIARDTASLAAFQAMLSQDGHPALWYLLLKGVQVITLEPEGMQALNGLVSLAVVLAIVWLSPFGRAAQLGLVLSYPILFEYGVKSRGYMLGTLLVVVACALIRAPQRRWIAIGLTLGLAANTHVLFIIIAGAMALALAVEDYGRGQFDGQRTEKLTALAILGLGIAFSYVTASPPPGSFLRAPPPLTMADLMDRLSIFGGLWGPSNDKTGMLKLLGGGVFIAFTGFLVWRRRWSALVFCTISILGIAGFLILRYRIMPWHSSLLFVTVVAACWCFLDSRDREHRYVRFAAMLVLASQVWFGLTTIVSEWHQPYAYSRSVARLLRDRGWTNDPVAIFWVSEGVGTSAYAPGLKVFDTERQSWETFARLAERTAETTDIAAYLERAAALGPRVTLLAHRDIQGELLARLGFREVARFTGAPVYEENKFVYRKG